NLDFADVRSVISGAGTAIMAIGEAIGERRAWDATQRAVESPLLERDIRGARRILLNVTGGSDLTLMEINEAATLIHSLAHPDATIIFGTVQDAAMQGRMRVTLIATGFAAEGMIQVHEEASHASTGTRPGGSPGGPVPAPPSGLPLLPQPEWRADVMTPETLLGDAWPLPAARPQHEEQPTVSLPALTPVRPGTETPAAEGSSPRRETEDADHHSGNNGVHRVERTIEMIWKAPTSGSSDDGDDPAMDIPAFLRRK
ncbi:MAG TPA: hypothetical protein VKB76_17170, partial [Ktedonobacterales bacterium]|nr:hypothetical protein [Ktedonobacterales bacterium]